MNQNEALGLPTGSVRAILALSLTAAAIGLVLTGRPMNDSFGALVVAAVTFYFAGRSGEAPVQPVVEPEQPVGE